MGVATTTTAPVEQVDDLIRQVADEAGLDVAAQVVSHDEHSTTFKDAKRNNVKTEKILFTARIRSYCRTLLRGSNRNRDWRARRPQQEIGCPPRVII